MRSVHGTLVLALVLGGCGTGEEPGSSSENSVASIESALEQENGGLEMQDDLASFGQPTLPDLDGVALDENLALPELPGLDALEGKQPLPVPPPPLPCPHGGLKGKWKELKNGFGVFFGKWGALGGPLHGHLKGIYGKNKKGEGVFFGKTINLGGKFVGLIKGRYENGFFKGRWFDKAGLRGELGGVYGKGELKGLWHAFCPKCAVKCEPGFAPGQGDPNAPAGVDPSAPKPGDPNAPVDPNAPAGTDPGMGPMGAPMEAPDKCLCLPPKVVACMMGKCPDGMICDLCPALCKPGEACPAVCGPPVCVPKPPKPPLPPAPNQAGAENIPLE
jgi:hypothetical protein